MSSYQAITKHPKTQQWVLADWLDDALGHHRYGVKFPEDEEVYDPEFIDLPTKESDLPTIEPDPEEVEGEYSPKRLERLKEEANKGFLALAVNLNDLRDITQQTFTNFQSLAKKLEAIEDEHKLPRF